MKMSCTFQICPIGFVLHGDNVPYTFFLLNQWNSQYFMYLAHNLIKCYQDN